MVAVGAVDELNSHLGMAAALSKNSLVLGTLTEVQIILFKLGADLATNTKETTIARIQHVDVRQVENTIDEADSLLPALTNFILPGGCIPAAELHICRTICRRAERAVVEAAQTTQINAQTIIFLNRLSDLLFVLARLEAKENGTPEKLWKP